MNVSICNSQKNVDTKTIHLHHDNMMVDGIDGEKLSEVHMLHYT